LKNPPTQTTGPTTLKGEEDVETTGVGVVEEVGRVADKTGAGMIANVWTMTETGLTAGKNLNFNTTNLPGRSTLADLITMKAPTTTRIINGAVVETTANSTNVVEVLTTVVDTTTALTSTETTRAGRSPRIILIEVQEGEEVADLEEIKTTTR
jgi:hypothetical protein